MTKILDQYQAACLLGISPELLRYFTEKTVKKNDARKLQVAYCKEDALYFDDQELKAYNDWLFLPWPTEGKQRPHLPDAFKREMRAEAAGECAICSKHGNSCEAAHIAPVAATKCNHPHNLLWLCANHHTKFDNGSLGPKGVDNELVKATKLVLQHARKHVWQQAAEVSTQIAALLKLAKGTTAYLQNTNSKSDAEVAKGIGKKVLKLLPTVTAKSDAESLAPIIAKISAALKVPEVGSSEVETTTVNQLELVASFEEEFLREAGLKNCPLCHGKRWYNEQECPVCQGEGTVVAGFNFDLTPYDLVTCRLCKGDKRVDGEDCPACFGEGQLEARVDERIDWSDFDMVTCKLCEGDRRWRGEECPVCGGEGRLLRRRLDYIDLSEYRDVECPLCDGTGEFKFDSCPECSGAGKMEPWRADCVDISKYQLDD